MKDEKGWAYMNSLGKEFYDLRDAVNPEGKQRREEILHEIVERSEPWVSKIARKLKYDGVLRMGNRRFVSVPHTDLEVDDLRNEANTGIMKYFRLYEPHRGAVSTFLSNVIASAMLRAVRQYTPVYVPVEDQTAKANLSDADRATVRRIGSGQLERLLHPVPGEHESDTPLIEMLAIDYDQDAHVNAAAMTQFAERALAVLRPEERTLLEHRYGLNGHVPKTHQQIADEHLLGKAHKGTRLRYMEERALRRIRFHLYQMQDLEAPLPTN